MATPSKDGTKNDPNTPTGSQGDVTPNRRVTRSNPGTPVTPSSRMSLREFMSAGRKQKAKNTPVKILDPYASAIAAKDMVRGSTGLVFDEFMAQHFNPWDNEHIEKPDRLLKSYERCNELGLIEKCVKIQSRKATPEELQLCHNQEYVEVIDKVATKTVDEMKCHCLETYHSVYMNDKTVECARMAAGSAIDLTKSILEGKIQNGIALIRPPGHHAMRKEGCGFCIFNNVAIAGTNILSKKYFLLYNFLNIFLQQTML